MNQQYAGATHSSSPQHRILGVVMALLLAVGIASASSLPSAAASILSYIPVIVNHYKDSGFTDEEVQDMIAEANRILSDNNANMTLIVVETNKNVTTGDTGSDGELAGGDPCPECKAVSDAGKKEIENTPNKIGLKISLVKDCDLKDPDAVGWNYLGEPVIVMENMGTATDNGNTVVHELYHGMGGEHTSGPGELTDPFGSGETIPQSALDTMNAARHRFCKCAQQIDEAHPGKRVAAQRGRSTDTRGDQRSPEYLDLITTELYSTDGYAMIDGYLSVAGMFEGEVNAVYVLAFDIDNDLNTGFGDGPFDGREYSVELWVQGDYGSYTVVGYVRDLANDLAWLLPWSPIIEISSVEDRPGSGFARLGFKIPKELLGLDMHYGPNTPAFIHVGVFVQSALDIHDEDDFNLRMIQWLLDPEIVTYGNGTPTPGAPYPFSLFGLQPDDDYVVYLDGEPIAGGTLDVEGTAEGDFVFPYDLPTDIPHFLYAQDSTGEFAYGMTCPDPDSRPPSSENPPPLTSGPTVAPPPPGPTNEGPPTTTPSYRPPISNPPTGDDPPIYGDIMVFPTPERFLNRDLNDDGDTGDVVLRYQNLLTGVVVNTGVVCSSAPHDLDIWGSIIVFAGAPATGRLQVSFDAGEAEFLERSGQPVRSIQFYDIDAGTVYDTGCVGRNPAIWGAWIVFENLDGAIQLFNVKSRATVETGMAGVFPAIYGEVVTFRAEPSGTIWCYDLSIGLATDTGARGKTPAIYEDLIAFSTPECSIGVDLNSDGDLNDEVIRYYILSTHEIINTGVPGTWPAVHGDTLVFGTNEASVGMDLNYDGKIHASVIQYLHLPTGQLINTEALGAVPDVYDGTISYHALEAWSGLDWSGDGDTLDSVVWTYSTEQDAWHFSRESAEDRGENSEPPSR